MARTRAPKSYLKWLDLMNKNTLLIGALALVAIAAFALTRPSPQTETAQSAPVNSTALVAINMPVIEGNAAIGQNIFENICAACHGPNGVGNAEAGPPLIHKIYEPSHHGDESFQRAVANGVRAHHWRFGNMPPVEGLTRGDVAMVIEYIREIQRANGIN